MEMTGWQPIATAPELERVMVCGWQKRNGTTQAYWWWGEDCVSKGIGIEHPAALYWCPVILPDKFPPPPQEPQP